MMDFATKLQEIAKDQGIAVSALETFARVVQRTLDDAQRAVKEGYDYIDKAIVKVQVIVSQCREDPTKIRDFPSEMLRLGTQALEKGRAFHPPAYPYLLNEMALIYRVALFDAVMPDILKATLIFNPDMLLVSTEFSADFAPP